MAVTNLLKSQVDQPVFEWLRFAPTATATLSALAASDDLGGRYFYYIVAQALWRYDTYSDSWQELAPPNTAPATVLAMKYSKNSGYRGHTISATSNTITVAGFSRHAHIPNEIKIRIIAGTGAGQERTITEVADAVIADYGIATTATTSTIGDSTKRWRVNQWDGYQCRLTYSTGQSQIRRILYNDTTILTFSDANFQAIDPFNNTGFSIVSPYAAPVTTAGSQTHFVIESTQLTVDTPWTVTPDQSSIYLIVSGGLWLLSSSGISPWTTWQFYDILSDTWQNKTPTSGHLGAALATDVSIDRTGEFAGASISGNTATASTIKTLVDSGATMAYDRWANYQLRIVSGPGIGQHRRIVGNTDTTFHIDHNWDVAPSATSQYSVFPNTDMIWMTGNGSSQLHGYSVERDLWFNGHMSDYGISRNISITPVSTTGYFSPHEGYAATNIIFNGTGVLAVTVLQGGTGFTAGELLNLITTGSGAQVWVTSVTGPQGAINTIELAACGTGYTSTVSTSILNGGSGTGASVNVVSVGKNALINVATNHDFRGPSSGIPMEYVSITGCSAGVDSSFNNTFGVIGVSSLTGFYIACPNAAASPTGTTFHNTLLMVDSAQNWTTNEHVGKLLMLQTGGTASPTLQVRRIISNTQNALGLTGAITAPTNGTSRYIIQEPRAFGAMLVNKRSGKEPTGWATSATSTTLVDTSKDWLPNQWVNCRVRITCGTGAGGEAVVTTNTRTTLTVASWPNGTPDATSKYDIGDSYGFVTTAGTGVATITDANKNWPTNSLAGKRIRFIGGTNIANEYTIVSNTATVITIGSSITTDTSSNYVIYEPPIRSTGTNLTWLFGLTDTEKQGKFLISPRGGGSNIFDLYDITQNRWDITPFFSPMSTTVTTGSMYTYDGGDNYYFTKDATGRVYQLDMNTFAVNAATTTPYAHSTAILGNRMEIVQTVDGLQYLYIMRHTGQEMWRTLKFW
jgi:hypothetical protein